MEPNKVSGRQLAVNGPDLPSARADRGAGGAGVRVALLTSADSWRGSGASFAAIYAGLQAHGHEPHLVTAAECVTRAFAERGMAATELPLRRTRPRGGEVRPVDS